jgi:hypothetical protein
MREGGDTIMKIGEEREEQDVNRITGKKGRRKKKL